MDQQTVIIVLCVALALVSGLAIGVLSGHATSAREASQAMLTEALEFRSAKSTEAQALGVSLELAKLGIEKAQEFATESREATRNKHLHEETIKGLEAQLAAMGVRPAGPAAPPSGPAQPDTIKNRATDREL